MNTEFKYFLVIFLWFVVNGCGRKCAETTFTFQTSISAYPDKDSIRVGDTIWYEAVIPATLVDRSTKQAINYSGASNLGTVLSILKFNGGSVTDPGVIPAAADFKYILTQGLDISSLGLDKNREYKFNEVGNQYWFKLGIVAQKKGTYFSAIDNPKNVYRTIDKCTKATYYINFTNTKQHLYLYQNNRPGYVISGLELTNTYCFKVY